MSDWVNSIGKQLIKSVKIEIPGVFWCQTQKHCKRCNKLFTYKDDVDYYNAKYKRATNDVYGKWLQPVVNDFSKDEKKLRNIFRNGSIL